MAHPNTGFALNPPEQLIFSGSHLGRKRKIYVVKENKDTEIHLSHLIVDGKLQVYDPVREGDFFTVYRKKDSLVFQAGGYVGLIPINDRVVLDVRPRVPLRNLARMMRIAEDTPLELNPFLSYYSGHDEAVPSMIDFFARAVINTLANIGFYGLYREYVERVRGTSLPRGRILIGETMRRYELRGIRHQVAASWYETSADTPPNRCLKYALWFLADHYKSTSKNQQKILQRIEQNYHLFSSVQLDKSLGFLRDPTVTNPETLPSIRAYYKPALYLALLIIQNRGISFVNRKGGVVMPSLLIDLKKTFENYLRNVLKFRLRNFESKIRVLDGNVKGTDGGAKPLFDKPLFKEMWSPNATPDIVINRLEPSADGSQPTLLVADAKYKDFKRPTRTEIEQSITYAASYRAPIVVIIHPRVEVDTHGLHLLGRIQPFSVYHYAYDLAARDPDLEERRFAKSFRGLLHV